MNKKRESKWTIQTTKLNHQKYYLKVIKLIIKLSKI